MKRKLSELPPVARTLLIPLAYRAMENRRPDAILKDERAAALLDGFEGDMERLVQGNHMEQVATLMRARCLDNYTRTFLLLNPQGIVVDIGCGLDTRFERINNGQMIWFGLDFPEVIAFRREMIQDSPRCHLIAASALDFAWMDVVAQEQRPVIFIAEGVFPYLEEADVRRLVVELSRRFPGSELAFDALTPASIWLHSLNHPGLKKTQAQLHWGINDARQMETWGAGIQLLEEWSYFNQGEARLRLYNWMRFIPLFARMNRILLFRLS